MGTVVELQSINAISLPLMPQQATLGILGGGQLGRFFLMAAKALGYRTVVWAPDFDSPAFGLADEIIQAPFNNAKAFQRFTALADGISYEFENLPVETLEAMEALGKVVSPSAKVLSICQNRVLERQFLAGLGLPVAPFEVVETVQTLQTAFMALNHQPCVLKTARLGYDGKGQTVIETLEGCSYAWGSLGAEASTPYVLEQKINFTRELSMIVARSTHGDMVHYPLIENRHHRHVLDLSLCPASNITETTHQQALKMAEAIATKLDLVGVLCIELFELPNGSLLINELAPRPHNSGHLTIEGCITSQYEQQVRALCGFALGDTSLKTPVVGMQNLMGELWRATGQEPPWQQLLAQFPQVKLHLYGKEAAKPGRKMGHLTLTGTNGCTVANTLLAAKECISPAEAFY